ncbi:hypothetical protein [Salmonella enterica]|uniref:hypothetical protein n=1 Tax=Salmonella enterica TaxID=28901 RepID=UPI0021B3B062|nr:hypothetical protein [Salmonella enterica]MCT7066754.1 hypothetical protein [Salmonella enterica subsp. enterica serovar Soahanina]
MIQLVQCDITAVAVQGTVQHLYTGRTVTGTQQTDVAIPCNIRAIQGDVTM